MHDAECIKIYRLRGPLLVKKPEENEEVEREGVDKGGEQEEQGKKRIGRRTGFGDV